MVPLRRLVLDGPLTSLQGDCWSDGLHGPCTGACTIAPQKVSQQNKSWHNSKSKLKFLGSFRGPGVLGVFGNHRKWLLLRACKIWCTSVRTTNISSCFPFLFYFYFQGSRRRKPPRRGHVFTQVYVGMLSSSVLVRLLFRSFR